MNYGLLFNHEVKKEYYSMDAQEFERLNYLSEKSIDDNVSLREMNEFKQLHEKWTKSEEFNLFVPFN
jgi:hypothetical protein